MIDLRALEDGDADDLFRWRTEREVDRWAYDDPPVDAASHRRWFDAFLHDRDRHGCVILWNRAPCGLVTLKGLSSPQQRAQLGWYIGEAEARGRGGGRAAHALALDHAFSLGLRRVWSETIAGNEIALKAQLAAGFRREGYLRRHAWKYGEARDVVVLGVLAEEWAARRAAVLGGLAASGLIERRRAER
jgi:RimJ/RimL family protein N-acetyltransferase